MRRWEEAGLGSFLWGAIHLHQLQFGGRSGVVVFSHVLFGLIIFFCFIISSNEDHGFRSLTQLKDLSVARSPWLGVILHFMHLYAIQDIHFIVYNIWIYLIIFHNTSHHASCIMHHASCIMHHACYISYHFWIHRWPFHISWDSQSSFFVQSTYACLGDLVKHSVYPAAQVLHLGNWDRNLWDWDRILGFPQSRSLMVPLYLLPVWRCQLATGHLLLQLFFVSGHPFLQSLKTFVCGLSSEISSQASTTAKRREKALRPTSDNVCSSVWKRCSTASPWLQNCSSSH